MRTGLQSCSACQYPEVSDDRFGHDPVKPKWRISGSPKVNLLNSENCSDQVVSDLLLGFFDVDSSSNVLGDKLPGF